MGYGFSDITLYGHSECVNNKAFGALNTLISDLYINFLDGYKPKGTTRISVDIGSKDNVKGYFGSILKAEALFNENEYAENSSAERSQIILETIHRIAIICAEKYGWDKAVFLQAYQKVIESKFVYKKELKKKLSKNRKYQACLMLEKDSESTIISVNFYNNDGSLIKSEVLLKSFQHAMFYQKIIVQNKWFNEHEFGIYLKNQEIVIKASIEKQGSKTEINPVTDTLEQLQGYLTQITYQDFANSSDFVKWANQ